MTPANLVNNQLTCNTHRFIQQQLSSTAAPPPAAADDSTDDDDDDNAAAAASGDARDDTRQELEALRGRRTLRDHMALFERLSEETGAALAEQQQRQRAQRKSRV